jgi:hypothetical protein
LNKSKGVYHDITCLSGAGNRIAGDWRKETGQELTRVMGEHLPFYGNTIASYMASKQG